MYTPGNNRVSGLSSGIKIRNNSNRINAQRIISNIKGGLSKLYNNFCLYLN